MNRVLYRSIANRIILMFRDIGMWSDWILLTPDHRNVGKGSVQFQPIQLNSACFTELLWWSKCSCLQHASGEFSGHAPWNIMNFLWYLIFEWFFGFSLLLILWFLSFLWKSNFFYLQPKFNCATSSFICFNFFAYSIGSLPWY